MVVVSSTLLAWLETGPLKKPWHALAAQSEHLIQQLMERANQRVIE